MENHSGSRRLRASPNPPTAFLGASAPHPTHQKHFSAPPRLRDQNTNKHSPRLRASASQNKKHSPRLSASASQKPTAMKQAKRITYTSPDYANMPASARADMLADLERHYFTPRYQCSPFDPTELVALALEQRPDRPEFAEALGRCTEQWWEHELYAYLQDPSLRATRAAYGGGFVLLCPRLGRLNFDMLKDGSMLGIEFMEAVMSLRGEGNAGVPPASVGLRVVHRKFRE